MITTGPGTLTVANTGDFPYAVPNIYYDESPLNIEEWKYKYMEGGENMRYLYEVILVNPKDDEFEIFELVARSETAALMYAYEDSEFSNKEEAVEFDDLKTQCRVLMSWKKEGE